MRAQPVDIKESTGRILCCTVFRPGGKKLLAKGHLMSEDDVRLLETEGMQSVWVTELEDGEVGEDEAVMMVAEEVGCGSLEIRLAAGGRANLVATEECCVLVDDELLRQINCTGSTVIATLPNFSHAGPETARRHREERAIRRRAHGTRGDDLHPPGARSDPAGPADPGPFGRGALYGCRHRRTRPPAVRQHHAPAARAVRCQSPLFAGLRRRGRSRRPVAPAIGAEQAGGRYWLPPRRHRPGRRTLWAARCSASDAIWSASWRPSSPATCCCWPTRTTSRSCARQAVTVR